MARGTCSVWMLSLLAAIFCGMPGHSLQDSEDYVVRYVSNHGVDDIQCLSTQPFDLNVTTCNSVRYALTGADIRRAVVVNISVMVYPGSYNLGEDGIAILNSENIVIKRVPGEVEEVVFRCAAFQDNGYNNLYIYGSRNIELHGIVFTMCGPLSPSVTFLFSRKIFIEDCTFSNNLNTGLVLYQVDDFFISNSTFQDNNSTSSRPVVNNGTELFRPGGFRFGGGLAIFASNVTNVMGSITNCLFLKNRVLVESQVENNLTRLYTSVGDGGAIAITFSNASSTNLTFDGIRIVDNIADDYGGGVSLTFTKGSQDNSVMFQNVVFKNNTAVNGAGGAISMNVFEKSNLNILIVQDAVYEANSASIGGGAVSIALQDNLISDAVDILSNVATFVRTNFTRNSATSGGSAVRLISNARIDQVTATTNFSDCSFLANGASNTSGSSVLSFRAPIRMSGTTVFRNNVGGALSLLRSRLDASGTLLFERNTAVQGGAVSMRDLSLINLLKDVNMTFYENYASERGGAMSAITATVGVDTDIIRFFNLRCFFQYDANNALPTMLPELWQASVSFINNTAESDGAAIYTSDITRCTYTNGTTPAASADTNVTGNSEYLKSIFPLSNVFSYSGNRVLNPRVYRALDDLATAPSQLIVEPQEVEAAPGESIPYFVGAVDQAGNWQSAIWSLNDKEEINTELENDFDDLFSLTPDGTTHDYAISDLNALEYSSIGGTQGFNRVLNFSLIDVIGGGVANVTQATVTIIDCHPGYKFDNLTNMCEYLRENSAILRPDIQRKYVYLKRRIYAEVREGRLVTALMPTTFQNCKTEGNSSIVNLRGCLFKFDAVDEQCSDNRSGFLCGVCPNDTSIDLTLRNCRKCTVRDAIIVAIIVIVFVVAALLVLIFNIGVPNDLKSCLFFVQVVGFVYTSSGGASGRWDYHLSRIFGFNLYLPLCPYPGFDALSTATYGFMLSSFAIATVVIYVISARFIRALSHRSSFNGFWLLSIIIYKYTADTCFSILQCVKVSGTDGEYAYYFNGSIKCFQSEKHLGLAIFALFLIVFVVLLFPLVILIISFKRFNLTHAFTDVLTNGLKVSCRWWSAFDLYRRLLFIILAFIFNYISPSFTRLALLFAGLGVLLVFAFSQPYQSRRANIIEVVVLFDLIVLTTLFLNDRDESTSQQQFAMLLLLLPFVIAAVFIIAKLVELVWTKVSPGTFKTLCMQFAKKMRSGAQHSNKKKVHTLEASPSVEVSDNDEQESEELHTHSQYSGYREELLDT